MKRKFVPQRPIPSHDSPIEYTFEGETITATFQDQSDTFDLSGLEVGDKIEEIKTSLPIVPVVDAWRDEKGELWVKLLYHVGPNPSQEEAFPEWEEV